MWAELDVSSHDDIVGEADSGPSQVGLASSGVCVEVVMGAGVYVCGWSLGCSGTCTESSVTVQVTVGIS